MKSFGVFGFIGAVVLICACGNNSNQAGGIGMSSTLPSTPGQSTGSGPDSYQQQVLDLINASRAQSGLPPYSFNQTESVGVGSCVGSYGHSVYMEGVGQINHDQFPADICVSTQYEGENVGVSVGTESDAIQILHQAMMNEGPSGGHYQNIMSSQYTEVGIGLYYVNGTLWLTEDFIKP